MRYFIVGDVHWSSYSSIVRSRGEKYSTRLENLINTITWVELEAQRQNCDVVVYLGDFFDKSDCNAEELTALQQIRWAPMRHYMLVGNHEMIRGNLELSSAHLFGLIPDCCVIDFPYMYNEPNNTSIMFLPYILENHRRPLKDYFDTLEKCDNTIIFSHNDIAGIQLGNFVSTSGFSIKEIEENCNLFINGHLHNGTEIGNTIINVGNITGQNFSEDAYKYTHKALVLDTDTKSLTEHINPYALNFYKVDLTAMQPTIDDVKIQNTLTTLKSPAVATIKVNSAIDFIVKDLLSSCDNIIECRLILEGSSEVDSSIVEVDNTSLDHIKKFQQYVYDTFGNSELVINELERISK